MKQTLTDRQRDIFNWIKAFTAENGLSPSLREIGDAFGMRSPNGVMCNVLSLKRKGWIECDSSRDHHRTRSRTIKVITDCGHPVQCERDGVCQWCKEVEEARSELAALYS